jgi:hypothetical protein
MTMPIAGRADLAQRTSGGVDVTLSWDEPTGRLTVGVRDARTEESFEFEVDGSHALDAFNHPYAYAAQTRTVQRTVEVAARRDSASSQKPSTNPWRRDHARTDR